MDPLIQLFFGPATWFTIPAIVGTVGFLLRFLIAWIGGNDGQDDAGLAGAHDAGGVADAGPHSDIAAATISVQGILTFLMGFGWGGLGSFRAADASLGVSVAVGLGCGVALLALAAMLLRAMRHLQSTGNISIEQLVGLEGEAYTVIPPAGQGSGQVRTVLGDRQRFVYAVTEKDEIPARTRVRIVRINGDNSVTVARL